MMTNDKTFKKNKDRVTTSCLYLSLKQWQQQQQENTQQNVMNLLLHT